jgi:predicted Zn finger-like uncharacterized protein
MRLVCPNCEAKYEVPDDAIPDTGRDVQCANCGHAWFQMRPRAAGVSAPDPVPEVAAQPEAAPEVVDVDPDKTRPPKDFVSESAIEAPAPATSPDIADPEPVASDVTPASDPAHKDAEPLAVAHEDTVTLTEASDAGLPVAAEVVEDIPEPTEPAVEAATGEVPDEGASPAAQPVPYAVDDSVLAILREEAEREANARRGETVPIETQTDLGVDAAVASTLAAAAGVDADGKPSARRDLFPDVEEINSTLRPSEHQDELADASDQMPVAPEGRRGFRSGFLTVMTIAILGAAVYVAAPMLRSAVPSLASPLDGYVAFVDGFRLQLDGLMRSATASLNAN